MEKASWSGSHEGILKATDGWLVWSIFKMGAGPAVASGPDSIAVSAVLLMAGELLLGKSQVREDSFLLHEAMSNVES